jgi:hypothetical protein
MLACFDHLSCATAGFFVHVTLTMVDAHAIVCKGPLPSGGAGRAGEGLVQPACSNIGFMCSIPINLEGDTFVYITPTVSFSVLYIVYNNIDPDIRYVGM